DGASHLLTDPDHVCAWLRGLDLGGVAAGPGRRKLNLPLAPVGCDDMGMRRADVLPPAVRVLGQLGGDGDGARVVRLDPDAQRSGGLCWQQPREHVAPQRRRCRGTCPRAAPATTNVRGPGYG